MFKLLLHTLYLTLSAILVANVIIAYLPGIQRNPIGGFIYRIGEIVLSPMRKIIRPLKIDQGTSMDLAPLITYFVVWILYKALLQVPI